MVTKYSGTELERGLQQCFSMAGRKGKHFVIFYRLIQPNQPNSYFVLLDKCIFKEPFLLTYLYYLNFKSFTNYTVTVSPAGSSKLIPTKI